MSDRHQLAWDLRPLIDLNNPQFIFDLKIDPPSLGGINNEIKGNTDFENAITIYRRLEDNHLVPLFASKNYNKNGNKTNFIGYTHSDTHTLIAGWHKNSGPNPQSPWYPSPVKVLSDSVNPDKRRIIKLGFEDSVSGQFQSVVMSIHWLP